MSQNLDMLPAMTSAFQFGFKCAEKGMNLQMAMDHFYETMNAPDDTENTVESDMNSDLPGEDMDGDAASALASAGFGTDEDYGGGTHDTDFYE